MHGENKCDTVYKKNVHMLYMCKHASFRATSLPLQLRGNEGELPVADSILLGLRQNNATRHNSIILDAHLLHSSVYYRSMFAHPLYFAFKGDRSGDAALPATPVMRCDLLQH